MTTARTDRPAGSYAATPGTEDTHQLPRHGHRSTALLALAALGIVFGDIGTSPLYSLQTVFSIEHNAVSATRDDVMGVISMVIWAITLIVSVKYVTFVMRADNDGEGGILALVALLKDRLGHRRLTVGAVLIGVVGAGLFYGDSVITPAISVMSAIEGLSVKNPSLEEYVMPLSVGVLTALFVIQRWGTAKVGGAFGPIMLAWFGCLAALGVPWIVQDPSILGALSPHHAVAFGLARPWVAFVAMGAVVLTITGAEALYADMGHFGATPIRLSWFFAVMPALFLCYLGQGAMLLQHPEYVDNPFFRMAPGWASLPLVVLATLATVIASQAVISGAFSVSRQATRLRLLPRFTIRHTSRSHGGQIYIPSINWTLFVGVLVLISVFQSSQRLATAYGLAVTGTLLLTTALFLVYARSVWRWPTWQVALFGALVGGLELVILCANVLKFFTGGWIPIVIAAGLIVVMTTWYRGVQIIVERREKIEGSLSELMAEMHGRSQPLMRVPGFAVFPHRTRDTDPLALRGLLQFARVLPETVLIVNVVNENVPHIRHAEREHLDTLGDETDGIYYVDCHVGFNDSQDVPKAVRLAIETFPQLAHLREMDATYFLSAQDVRRNLEHSRMAPWRSRLFVALAKNQADARAVYHTPKERSVILGSDLYL